MHYIKKKLGNIFFFFFTILQEKQNERIDPTCNNIILSFLDNKLILYLALNWKLIHELPSLQFTDVKLQG